MKAVTYCRTLSDRLPKGCPSNFIYHQLNNCRNIAKNNNLEIYKEIYDIGSAKLPGTREGFIELINVCKTRKIDYIICNESIKLARNDDDMNELIKLYENNYIKGILISTDEFISENIPEIKSYCLSHELLLLFKDHREQLRNNIF